MQIENLHSKFDHIHRVISTDEFLNIRGLNGEIPFWISPYNPIQEVDIQKEIINLEKRLANEGVTILSIDLFELSMDIIQRYVGVKELLAIESKKKKDTFKRALQSTINIHERMIPTIKATVEEQSPRVLLLTGVGKVFPFIRSHSVLNNLQSAIKSIPTLMFFPGNYTGQSLELFGLLKDDNYYRASNIDIYKL